MGKITVETCPIEGLKVITPTVFGDEREQVLIDMQDKGESLLQKRKVGHDGFP